MRVTSPGTPAPTAWQMALAAAPVHERPARSLLPHSDATVYTALALMVAWKRAKEAHVLLGTNAEGATAPTVNCSKNSVDGTAVAFAGLGAGGRE